MAVQILWLSVLNIARKDDQVRVLGIDTVDGPFQNVLIAICIGTHMGIGEQYNLISVEGFGQVA